MSEQAISQPLIHILPPQLANQIAAGEVVERPASVVKELVENSLDAGATQIQIEIEKGGAQLIRIRDNGCGIGKQDLALALARHATSKISSLDDLENILSLGFRGEALASISSVSRLTLTSRPAYQNEAWQAYAQGREMAVEIKPASHPIGTTIEVANLFFNTPARRKFLRSDKTEFAHIDEVIRRIALAKPTVSFTLSHNDKKIRHYRAVADHSLSEHQKRVAAVCGEEFIDQAAHIDWQHHGLHLYGWVADSAFARLQNDLCYSYVNGRMMRDKTINHAIRQAFGDRLGKEQYPAFVLFLDLAPNEVDVNVHPAKHEVRFQQARLVHDFIFQGVWDALNQQAPLPLTQTAKNHDINEPLPHYVQDTNRKAAGQNMFAYPSSSRSFSHTERGSVSRSAQTMYGELIAPTLERDPLPRFSNSYSSTNLPSEPPVILQKTAETTPLATPFEVATPQYSQALAIVANKAVLLKEQNEFYLLPFTQLVQLSQQQQLKSGQNQPLLIPLSLNLDEAQQTQWQKLKADFAQLGFVIQEKQWQGKTKLAIERVPTLLREQNFQQLILNVLAGDVQGGNLGAFFAKQLPMPSATLADAIRLLAELEQHNVDLSSFKIAVDFSCYLQEIAE